MARMMLSRRSFGASLLVGAMLRPALGDAAVSLTAGAPILAKPEQFEREAIALRLLATREVQSELAIVKALFAKSPIAADKGARDTIDRATDALAYQAALYAANFDTIDPFILWSSCAAHQWNGMSVPSTGYGLDAPDNTYRSATLDGAARYAIRGVAHGTPPSQQSFVIYRTLPGVTPTFNSAGHMDEIAGTSSDRVKFDADGSFTLTIDADPANGRLNHLQVPADLNGLHLLVRDSLADWTKELPYDLTIKRLDKPAQNPVRDEQAMARHAGDILKAYAPYFLHWFESYVYAKPLNEVVPPWKRVQGWGLTQQGRFALNEDEVWVMTFDPLGAKFFDLQISDPWTKAVEYVSRSGSLNGTQAVADDDGMLTLVAGPKDPGVWNWLDTAGLSAGTFQVRWQNLPQGAVIERAVQKVGVVKIKDIPSILPTGTRHVTPAQRSAQLRDRAKSYERRLT